MSHTAPLKERSHFYCLEVGELSHMRCLRRVGSTTVVIGGRPESNDLADLPGLNSGEGADSKDDRVSDATRHRRAQAMQALIRLSNADEADSSENGRTEVGNSSGEPGSSQPDEARDGSAPERLRASSKRNSAMGSDPACSTEAGSKSQDQRAAGAVHQRDRAPADDSEGHSSRSSSPSEETCTSEHSPEAEGAKDPSMSAAARSARSERAKTERDLLSAISSNGRELRMRDPDSFWPQLSGGPSAGFCPSLTSCPEGIHAAVRRVLIM